jgi:hypothetical protein
MLLLVHLQAGHSCQISRLAKDEMIIRIPDVLSGIMDTARNVFFNILFSP